MHLEDSGFLRGGYTTCEGLVSRGNR